MKLTYFIYLQLTIRGLIKHFTVIYGDANKQFLTLNFNIFCREKISLSGTPISIPKIADLPLWAQEKITCMVKLGSTRAPDATYQLSRSSAFWFREEDFEGFLPYMGMAAILVMWPGSFELTFVVPSYGGSIWNLILIGKQFLGRRCLKRVADDHGQRSLPVL